MGSSGCGGGGKLFQTKEGGLELFLSEVSELVDTTAVGRSSGVVKFNTFNIGFENVEWRSNSKLNGGWLCGISLLSSNTIFSDNVGNPDVGRINAQESRPRRTFAKLDLPTPVPPRITIRGSGYFVTGEMFSDLTPKTLQINKVNIFRKLISILSCYVLFTSSIFQNVRSFQSIIPLLIFHLNI